jgi:Protein of unknown function (DUF4242)
MRLPCYADSPAAIEALTRDGLRLLRLGNLHEAEYVLHRAAGGADHLAAGPDVPLIRLRAREALAATYRCQGRDDESEALLRSTIAKAERSSARTPPRSSARNCRTVPQPNQEVSMNLYAILRRDGWRTPEDLQEAAARSTAVGETMSDDVRWIRSYVVEQEDGVLGTVCIYEATSPEAIRKHASSADLPATEIFPVADTVIVREDPVPAG